MNTPEKQFITIDGHRMAYITAGRPDLPPVILVHGWMSHCLVWGDTMTALSDHYYCIAPDVIGLGDSDKPADGDYSIANQSRQIVALADALGLNTFALMGHSRGGQIALHIAAITAPGRVTRLVDVDGVVTGRLGRYIERVLVRRVHMAMKLPWIYDLFLPVYRRSRLFSRLESSPSYYDIRRVPENLWYRDLFVGVRRETSLTNYLTAVSIQAVDLTPNLPDVQVPTLVIFGKQDRVVPVDQGELAAARIPGAELVLFDECGHYPMYEKTSDYLQAVQGFMIG